MIDTLTKTMIRMPWDISTSSLGYIAKTLFPGESLEDRLGQLAREAIAAGDHLSRGTTLSMMHQAAEALEAMLPGQENHLALLEFQNKIDAYGVFEYVESVLALPDGVDQSLTDLVHKARGREPYTSVWATEGVGHLYAERSFIGTRQPRNLLTEEALSTLPDASLITLHAGMGLSIAERLLKTLPFQSSRADVREIIHRFLEMCDENSRDGYKEITIEALGLVTRTLYPGLVHLLDHELSETDPKILSLFWHGVGRGLYFLPVNFVPHLGSAGRAIEMAKSEAPHPIGRHNAVSGVAWPLTLVNIRHPEIMTRFLATNHSLIRDNDAFAQGVSTAVLTWYDSVPDDPALRAFLDHRPASIEQELWKEQVSGPSETAIQTYYPVIKENWRLGELFRYQSLSQLTGNIRKT